LSFDNNSVNEYDDDDDDDDALEYNWRRKLTVGVSVQYSFADIWLIKPRRW